MNRKGHASERLYAGRYRILEEIGRGRFGTVYRGEDTKLGTPVAVKELDPLWCRDPKAMARFTLEAKVAARLNHPNIVRVHDLGVEEGTYFLVMDYIAGESLKELLSEGKPLPLEQVVDIVRQVASALDYAHSQGVFHRDLKPSNIIIEKGTGRVFITDFGLAKVPGEPGLTETGEVIGTPEYIAPDKELDHRSDIYSLGVMLFEMCTGRVPFKGEDARATLLAHYHEPVPPPRKFNRGLPEAVEDVIRRALAKHPLDRYQRAGELAKALEWAAGKLKAKARETAAPQIIKGRPQLKVSAITKALFGPHYYTFGTSGVAAGILVGLVGAVLLAISELLFRFNFSLYALEGLGFLLLSGVLAAQWLGSEEFKEGFGAGFWAGVLTGAIYCFSLILYVPVAGEKSQFGVSSEEIPYFIFGVLLLWALVGVWVAGLISGLAGIFWKIIRLHLGPRYFNDFQTQ